MSYWKVHIPKRVAKEIKRFPKQDELHILNILEEFADDPWRGDIVKIQGEKNLWRRRIGNYRIFYSAYNEDYLVEIKEIERRTSKTY